MKNKSVINKKVVSLQKKGDMMKRIISFSILFISLVSLNAQTISVSGFYMDPSDLTANTAGTIVMDQNGHKCALIKIETTYTGFSFGAGAMGIVKTEQKVGEIWVYLPEGVKRLSVSHPQLGVLCNYDLGQTLKRARTYIMRLNTGESVSIKQTPDPQYILFKVTPQNATVILDGDTLITKNGTAEIKKEYGTYDYRVEARNYLPEIGKVTIKEQDSNIVFNVNLKSEIGGENQPVLTFKVGNAYFSMMFVEGGTFQMGGDPNSDPGSREIHQVTLSPFYIGETEVTQQLWMAVMGKNNNPSVNEGDNYPVTNICWDDCQDFLVELNKRTGRSFRLPTEAEWEYAAKGGGKSRSFKYSGSNVLGVVGWYHNNSSNVLHKVKTKQCNELGLYDMSGNVSEWCVDWFGNYPSRPQVDPKGPTKGIQRVLRGGNVMSVMKQCGVAFREAGITSSLPDINNNFVGFRIVLNH